MTDQVLRDALRMCARELAALREALARPIDLVDEEIVNDVVAEFLEKARGSRTP